jgi:hypothetical protein
VSETENMLKEKRFSDVEDIKSSVKRILTDILVQDLKTFVINGRSAGNIVKNLREINCKKSMLLISAAFKINF